jgi:hypothetical protein
MTPLVAVAVALAWSARLALRRRSIAELEIYAGEPCANYRVLR